MSFHSSHTPEDRATPPCPHFGPCGGCQLQHLTYPAQLELKAAHLRALFATTGLTIPELQLHASPPFAYRNRIRLSLAQVDDRLRAGYIRNPNGGHNFNGGRESGWPILSAPVAERVGYRTLSAAERVDRLPPSSAANPTLSFLPIAQCPIAAPILWRATEAFLTLANEGPVAWLSAADQLELFTAGDESRLQLTLYLRANPKSIPANLAAAFSAFCEQLRSHIPELTGAAIALLPAASTQRSRRTEATRPGPAWGAAGLNYRVSEIDYWVPRSAFFQTNRFLLPELLSVVTADRTGAFAWDLYAGVGLFSRALARSFAEVVAVEIAEPAASALAATKLPNLRAVKATTLDFLRAAAVQRDRPSLIVLDPPRTGAGPEVCALLARIAAPTVVYVSCSPETLPRDLATLTASGYTVTQLRLLDLFPQTTHIETVAVLTR